MACKPPHMDMRVTQGGAAVTVYLSGIMTHPFLQPAFLPRPPGPPAQLQVQLVNGRLPVHGVNESYYVQPPPSCWAFFLLFITTNSSLNLSKPLFPHLSNGPDNTHLTRLLGKQRVTVREALGSGWYVVSPD